MIDGDVTGWDITLTSWTVLYHPKFKESVKGGSMICTHIFWQQSMLFTVPVYLPMRKAQDTLSTILYS